MPRASVERLRKDRSEAQRRHELALRMRREGKSIDEIAEACNWTVGSAQKILCRMLKKVILEDAEDIKKIEDQRLDALLEAVWPQAVSGDYKAVEVSLKIMERRANLRGIDAPKKVETREDIVKRIEVVQIHMPALMGDIGDSAPLLIEGSVTDAEVVELPDD